MADIEDVAVAIQDVLDGATVQATGMNEERLQASAYALSGQQTVFPIAFVIPPATEMTRGVNNMLREVIPTLRVRFLLHDTDITAASKRLYAWRRKAKELIGANYTLGGLVTGANIQGFGELGMFGANGGPPYGFDMELSIPFGIVEEETTRAA